METKRHSVNLKQYRKVGGKWQFVPVARDAKGNPNPRLVLIDGEPTSSNGGTSYLEFKHHGKRRQESIGTIPRVTIERAIELYLVEVEATKGRETYRQYRNELEVA